MSIVLNGTTGITTPDVTSDGLTVDSTTLVVDETNNRVGINTSSPNFPLSFGANIGKTIALFENAGTSVYGIGMGGAGSGGDPYRTKIFSNGSERMAITDAGDVMIGGTTVSADARLNVYQSDSGQRVVHFENTRNVSGDENLRLVLGTNCNNTASAPLVVTTAGADKLYIHGNGNVVNTNNSYGALSDIKLKENVVDATPKLADLMQVKVRSYNLIGDTTKQIGVVAQELETVFPGMIDESPDRDSESNDLGTTTKSVKYSVFVPMLIKAIQEQQAIIELLTARVSALEAV